jgi:NADPH-dependent curcumin reductase CurA
MRGRMTGIRTYVDGFDVSAAIVGGAVGRVASRTGAERGRLGQLDARLARRQDRRAARCALDPRVAPPSAALGALGMPGFTADRLGT